MRFQLRPGGAIDALLDLPWHEPLDRWDDQHVADGGEAGVGVQVVVVDGADVELRELPRPDAERANQVLRALREEGVQAVDVVGVVTDRADRAGAALPAVLLTVRPERAFTHEVLLDADVPDEHDAVLDAAVGLLVQLHLVGFAWHGGGLGRMRFRRDAGLLSALLVEVGEGEIRGELSAADRLDDLELATSTIAEELLAAGAGPADEVTAMHALRHDVRSRYRELWHELTREEEVEVGDRERGDARLRRVNELGFDVEEIQVTGGTGRQVRVGPAVLEPGHHRRRLWRLTHLAVGENQARRLLEEIDRFRAAEQGDEAAVEGDGDAVAAAAMRWLLEVFHPTVGAVPAELRGPELDDAEVFHEILEHRYYLSERAGHDVGTQAAVDAYVTDVLAPGAARRSVG